MLLQKTHTATARIVLKPDRIISRKRLMPNISVHLRPTEKTAHLLGVLLAVFRGDDYLILLGWLGSGSVWMAFDEYLYSHQSFACDGDRSDVWIVRGVLQFALLLLGLRRSFGSSLVVD